MNQYNKKAFTLVELIVVITIIAILGTIAFISLQGYSAQARDSKRLSDIQNIKKSLELFTINAGKYPLPDGGEEVLYGVEDDLVWTQGIIGNTVSTNLSRNLNEKPIDPLTELEYIYSVINSQTKYELLSIYESDLVSYNNLLNQTNAVNTNYPKIDGNYNGILVKTTNYYFPTPSLITSEIITGGITLNSTNIKSQIVTGGNNIPSVGITESVTEGLNITLSVYTGSIDENSLSDKTDLLNIIKNVYAGTTLANQTVYKELLAITEPEDIKSFIDYVILNSSTFSTPTVVINNNCEASTKLGSTYSTITYNYNIINNGESLIGSGSMSIDDGTKNYTGNILCTNGTTTISNENETINCNTNFIWNGSICNFNPNYNTWDTNNTSSHFSLSNNNLTVTHDYGALYTGVRGTLGKSSGKWYWELIINNYTYAPFIGIVSSEITNMESYSMITSGSIGYYSYLGTKYVNGISSSYGDSYKNNDIVIGIALDLDNNAIWFSQNGIWQGSATLSEIENANLTHAAATGLIGTYYSLLSDSSSLQIGWIITANFGQSSFNYTVPSGFTSGLY